jgi:hypothetical protein
MSKINNNDGERKKRLLRLMKRGLQSLAAEYDASPERCPDSITLENYARGNLNEERTKKVSRHIAFCRDCFGNFLALLGPEKVERLLRGEKVVPARLDQERTGKSERHSGEPFLRLRLSSQAPQKLKVDEITRHYHWYADNLCGQQIFDPRGYRVRFFPTLFLRLLKVKNQFGNEPKGRRAIMEKIEAGEFRSRAGELGGGFTPQARRTLASALPMTKELSWLRSIATSPDVICTDWRIPYWCGPRKDREAYLKNFGTADSPLYRVMICKVKGANRDVIAVFSRRPIGKSELERQEYPAA